MITWEFKLTMFTCRCCCLNFRPLTCYTSMIQELTHRDSASLKALFPWYISEHLSLLEPISEIVFYQSEKARKSKPNLPRTSRNFDSGRLHHSICLWTTDPSCRLFRSDSFATDGSNHYQVQLFLSFHLVYLRSNITSRVLVPIWIQHWNDVKVEILNSFGNHRVSAIVSNQLKF